MFLLFTKVEGKDIKLHLWHQLTERSLWLWRYRLAADRSRREIKFWMLDLSIIEIESSFHSKLFSTWNAKQRRGQSPRLKASSIIFAWGETRFLRSVTLSKGGWGQWDRKWSCHWLSAERRTSCTVFRLPSLWIAVNLVIHLNFCAIFNRENNFLAWPYTPTAFSLYCFNSRVYGDYMQVYNSSLVLL